MTRASLIVLTVAVAFSPAFVVACGGDDVNDARGRPGSEDDPEKSGSGDGGADDGSSGGGPGTDPGNDPSIPNADTIPWASGTDIGTGVAAKDTMNPNGRNIFIGYADFGTSLEAAQKWVNAFYDAALKQRGVRYVYAVQGPAAAGYDGREISNSRIAAALTGSLIGPETKFIAIAAHGSGAFVADELIEQLGTTLDTGGLTTNKLVFFNLDGGEKFVTAASLNRLKRVYYVGARSGATLSPNHATMNTLGTARTAQGGFYDFDVAAAGCTAAPCVHAALVTTKPHNLAGTSILDYEDFLGRPVEKGWLETKAQEAGLVK